MHTIARSVILLILLACVDAQAQTPLWLTFSHPELTEGKPIQLEAFEYRPKSWNGKVILMSHGSTGGKDSGIKASIKYLNISKQALASGYVFIAWMRKGRGQSEGRFTEETGRCDPSSLKRELLEAEEQLQQVIAQVQARHGVGKLILMGHSRGGFLSSMYAAKHPEQILGVVNLAGVWSAFCERKSGNYNRQQFEQSAASFPRQFWLYFEKDSYFASDRFDDPDYAALSRIAASGGLIFRQFGAEGMPDGHQTPTFKPEVWAPEIFPLLDALPGK